MNLKDKFNIKLILALLGIVVIIVSIFFHPLQNQESKKPTDEELKTFKKVDYEELSPDGLNKIISYKTLFDPSFYGDYYKEYFDNNIIISARDMEDGRENYIFIGGRLGEPKWLGNVYVFFTSYCGSSCQGIYLVNVFNKETEHGVLSYMTQGDNKPVYTHFKDWFGHEFKFNGWVDGVRSETVDEKTYLIFDMGNGDKESIGQKRFLFTGNALEE